MFMEDIHQDQETIGGADDGDRLLLLGSLDLYGRYGQDLLYAEDSLRVFCLCVWYKDDSQSLDVCNHFHNSSLAGLPNDDDQFRLHGWEFFVYFIPSEIGINYSQKLVNVC